MCRTVAQVFPVLLVMVVAVQEYGGAGLAMSTDLYHLLREEIVMSIISNQMAILKNMNESSCVCASRDSELREIRLLKEETKKQLQAMEETAKGHLEVMEEEVKDQLLVMKEEVNGELETMKEEVKADVETMKKMKGELEVMKEEVESQLTAVKQMLETVQNTSITTPSQQSDPRALKSFHNDTDPSLCWANKVLYGSRGSLSPSHPSTYSDNMVCEWRVILPKGTRPVFRWEYIQIEGNPNDCSYDYVSVAAPGVSDAPLICGDAVPPQHPMYSIKDNEFIVTFTSDDSINYKGFLLHYKAEIYEVSA